MSDVVFFSPVRAVDSLGEPVAGAKARFFLSGTTTPVTVFADEGLTIAHPTPLVADQGGIFASVFHSGDALKATLTDANDVPLPGSPIDPIVKVAAIGGAAGSISFNPTASIPVTDVQAAIERVQENLVAPLLDGGVGVTGNAPILSNLDVTDTASGFYRFTSSAGGTLPSGWESANGIVWLLRESASDAIMFATNAATGVMLGRRLVAGVWQAWGQPLLPIATQAQAQAATDTNTLLTPLGGAQLVGKLKEVLVSRKSHTVDVGEVVFTGLAGFKEIVVEGHYLANTEVSFIVLSANGGSSFFEATGDYDSFLSQTNNNSVTSVSHIDISRANGGTANRRIFRVVISDFDAAQQKLAAGSMVAIGGNGAVMHGRTKGGATGVPMDALKVVASGGSFTDYDINVWGWK